MKKKIPPKVFFFYKKGFQKFSKINPFGKIKLKTSHFKPTKEEPGLFKKPKKNLKLKGPRKKKKKKNRINVKTFKKNFF